MSSTESSFSNSISVSDSLDDFCMPTLLVFYILLLFVPNSLLLVSLTAKMISSLDTPATTSYKEKLLIALHNSIFIILLDICEQNILVIDEEWVGCLLDFPITGVVERKV